MPLNQATLEHSLTNMLRTCCCHCLVTESEKSSRKTSWSLPFVVIGNVIFSCRKLEKIWYYKRHLTVILGIIWTKVDFSFQVKVKSLWGKAHCSDTPKVTRTGFIGLFLARLTCRRLSESNRIDWQVLLLFGRQSNPCHMFRKKFKPKVSADLL